MRCSDLSTVLLSAMIYGSQSPAVCFTVNTFSNKNRVMHKSNVISRKLLLDCFSGESFIWRMRNVLILLSLSCYSKWRYYIRFLLLSAVIIVIHLFDVCSI